MQKKVLFLYNGGTIGQKTEIRDGNQILVAPKDDISFREVCEPIIKRFSESMEVSFELVTTKDSSNMTPTDWQTLIFRIEKAQNEGYDAVGIAHGTDTLAYTATALSLALHGIGKSGLRIPVCITGAQNPVYKEGGDGRFNLENLFRTLDVCMKKGVADIVISFWNRVFLGCRTLKTSEKNFDAMKSPAYPDIGIIDATGVNINTNLLKNKKESSDKLDIASNFGDGVISFELTPGIEPDIFLDLVKNCGVSAIILKSLGEGNVCSEGRYNLLPVIKKITNEYKIPLFITTKFMGGNAVATHYETGYEAIKAGGIPCFDHTDVAVDVKVRWLLGNKLCSSVEDYRKAMMKSFAGEVTPQNSL